MAIHDDNWTKEFAKTDPMKMCVGDRIMHFALGLILLSIFVQQWMPAGIKNFLEGVLIATTVFAAIFFMGYFFYKAFTGRW